MIAELEGTLAAAATEADAQQEEQEQLLRCLDAAGDHNAPSDLTLACVHRLELSRDVLAAGDISAMKDEKAALLQLALTNTEQLLQERDALVSQTASNLHQAQECISHHANTIVELQATVSALEGQVAHAEASALQLQQAFEKKQAEFDTEKEAAAAALDDVNLQLTISHDEAEQHKSTVALLQNELAAASEAARAMEQEQAVLVQCIVAAEEVIALKDDKAAAMQDRLNDMEHMFATAAQTAAEVEQELEQVTSLADVTQLQLDTATAEAEAAAQQHAHTVAQLAASVAKAEQLQLEASELSQRVDFIHGQMQAQQQSAAAAADAAAAVAREGLESLSAALAAKEADFAASSSRAESLAATVERLQQLLHDVQDSASAAEQRSNVAEELAREMYTHTHAAVTVPSSSGSGAGEVVHELRGQVAALQQELQERAKEQMEWLAEMDGMRRLVLPHECKSHNFHFFQNPLGLLFKPSHVDAGSSKNATRSQRVTGLRWTRCRGFTTRAAK